MNEKHKNLFRKQNLIYFGSEIVCKLLQDRLFGLILFDKVWEKKKGLANT